MSSITLRNETLFRASYFLKKGQQVIAHIQGLAEGAMVTVPTVGTYKVTAETVIDGKTYKTTPYSVEHGMGFLAQVTQNAAPRTYEFHMVPIVCSSPNTLEFQKTCLGDVIFTIHEDFASLQHVLVGDPFHKVTIELYDTFYIYAVINGVTTATTEFSNPRATVTAVSDSATRENGYFTLVVS